MPSSYIVQAVGKYGEPDEDMVFYDSVVGQALDWIQSKFSAGAPRVHVWHVGGKIIATLKSPPPPVQSLRDLLLFDAVARTSDGNVIQSTITPMRRTTPTLAPATTPKNVKRASSGDMPDMAQLLTEAVAEEKGN